MFYWVPFEENVITLFGRKYAEMENSNQVALPGLPIVQSSRKEDSYYFTDSLSYSTKMKTMRR